MDDLDLSLIDPTIGQQPITPQVARPAGGGLDMSLIDPYSASLSQGWAEAPPQFGESKPRGWMNRTQAALSDSPKTRLEVLAKSIFPGEPLDKAMNRIGRVDGKLVYYGNDKQLHSLEYEMPGVEAAADWSAEFAGRSPSIALGLSAGAFTAGNPAGIAAGAMAGEILRKGASEWINGEQITSDDIAGAAGLEGLLALAGAFPAKIGANTAMRRVAADMSKIGKDGTTLLASAKRWGVPLTLAEETQIPSLMAKEKLLAMLPGSEDILNPFYLERRSNISDAVGKFIDTISAEKSTFNANQNFKTVSEKVIAKLNKARTEAVRPLYQEAEAAASKIDPTPILEKLDYLITNESGPVKSKLVSVRKSITDKVTTSSYGPPSPTLTLTQLDAIKQGSLDDAIEVAKRAGERHKVAVLTDLKNDLVSLGDEASGGAYAKARQAYQNYTVTLPDGKSYSVQEMEDLLKRASSLRRESEDNAIQAIFANDVAPEQVLRTRLVMKQAGHEKEWNDLVAGKIRDTFMSLKDNNNVGRNMSEALFADKATRLQMKSAMSDEQFKVFSDLMDVLGRTGRSGESWTAAASSRLGDIKRDAESVKTRIFRTVTGPLKARDSALQAMTDNDSQQFVEALANALIKGGDAGLNDLRKLALIKNDPLTLYQEIGLITSKYGANTLEKATGTGDLNVPQDQDFYNILRRN